MTRSMIICYHVIFITSVRQVVNKMHGRVKVRTTAEQNEIKRLEREAKSKKYKLVVGKLLESKHNAVFTEDVLDMCANVLLSNPDIITIWNYRREVFHHLKEKLNETDFKKLLEKDLNLTEQCLRVNPKSYGSWHHRIWILENIPEPDWNKEIKICTKYLELDERNFLCWDYRRVICRKAEVPDMEEYEFSTQKIATNFSNYSSWHYRSKLLPKIFPDLGNKLPIDEKKHKEELELVLNAAFTDPNDTSAWFYQRWLLGLVEPAAHIIGTSLSKNVIRVYLSKSISLKQFYSISLNHVSETCGLLEGEWKNESNSDYSKVWLFTPDKLLEDEMGKLEINLNDNGTNIDQFLVDYNSQDTVAVVPPRFNPLLSESLKEVLEDQLAACEELLSLESDSKWTLLTSAFLMKYIDFVKYSKQISETLETLKEVDAIRLGYYSDLQSRFSIEFHLSQCSDSQAFNLNKNIKLSNLHLTNLYHMQYLFLIEELDLSQNNLKSESLSQLSHLLSCRSLILDNNEISNLTYLPKLPNLNILSVKVNPLVVALKKEDFQTFPALKQVFFSAGENIDILVL